MLFPAHEEQADADVSPGARKTVNKTRLSVRHLTIISAWIDSDECSHFGLNKRIRLLTVSQAREIKSRKREMVGI